MIVKGLQINITFDETLLRAVTAYPTPRSTGFVFLTNTGRDTVVVMIFGTGMNDYISPGTGPVAEIIFDVTNDASPGDSTLLHVKDAMLFNIQSQVFPIKLRPSPIQPVLSERFWDGPTKVFGIKDTTLNR